MTSLQLFLFGAVGGCCPTIAKLAAYYSANPKSELPALGTYIGLILFALLGGIIARAFATGEMKAALAAGIAAPALVTNILAGAASSATSPNPVGVDQITENTWFVSAAHAQLVSEVSPELAQFSGESQGLVTIEPNITGGGAPRDSTIYFSWGTQDGESLGEIPGWLSATQSQSIAIPPGATTLSIGGETISTEELLRDGGVLSLKVETAPTIGGDFLWALGAQRSYAIQDIQVER